MQESEAEHVISNTNTLVEKEPQSPMAHMHAVPMSPALAAENENTSDSSSESSDCSGSCSGSCSESEEAMDEGPEERGPWDQVLRERVDWGKKDLAYTRLELQHLIHKEPASQWKAQTKELEAMSTDKLVEVLKDTQVEFEEKFQSGLREEDQVYYVQMQDWISILKTVYSIRKLEAMYPVSAAFGRALGGERREMR